MTRSERSASRRAAASPAAPAPMMTISVSIRMSISSTPPGTLVELPERAPKPNSPVDCVTQQGIPVHLKAVVIYKVGDDFASIANAARRFLDQQDQMNARIQNVFAGHLRAICGSLTVEELIRERDKLTEATRSAAGTEMEKLGLVIDSLQIQEIDDPTGYIANLAKPHAVAILKDARIAEAHANREATETEQSSAARRAQAIRDSAITQATYQADVDRAAAQAKLAGSGSCRGGSLRKRNTVPRPERSTDVRCGRRASLLCSPPRLMRKNLNGARVALLETRFSSTLANLVEMYGGRPYAVPALRETVLDGPRVDQLVQGIAAGRFSTIIFQTGVAAQRVFEEAHRRDMLPVVQERLRKCTTVVRGPKPAAVLFSFGVKATVTIDEPYTTRELLSKLATIDISRKYVALLHYGERNAELSLVLRTRGARLAEFLLYEWCLPLDTAPAGSDGSRDRRRQRRCDRVHQPDSSSPSHARRRRDRARRRPCANVYAQRRGGGVDRSVVHASIAQTRHPSRRRAALAEDAPAHLLALRLLR